MANGNFPQSDGYRADRNQDGSRASPDHRFGDDGHSRSYGETRQGGEHETRDRTLQQHDFGAGTSGNREYAGRDFAQGGERNARFSRNADDGRRDARSGEDRYGRFGRDEFGGDFGYGDTEQSRAWARESFRANPSGFTYEPARDRARLDFDDRASRGYGRAAYGSDYGSPDYRSGDYRARDYDDRRGFMERAGDEVASWFGDDQARERRRMDEHRGKGPKGYQRSDARIAEDVNDRLSDDPVLDASNLSVTVKNSEVTLDGFVSSRWDKRRAEDVVEGISGVKHVQNNLRVQTVAAQSISGSRTV